MSTLVKASKQKGEPKCWRQTDGHTFRLSIRRICVAVRPNHMPDLAVDALSHKFARDF